MNSGSFLLAGLGILFIALKLTEVINWSWWLVLLPIYGGAAFVLVLFVIAFIIAMIGSISSRNNRRW